MDGSITVSSQTPLVTVIVCTHNPRRDVLARTLGSLRGQTLSADKWELLIVDNASKPPLPAESASNWHREPKIIREPAIGLTPARLRGIAEAKSPLLVFVDDDNLLDADYLAASVRLFSEYPRLGAAGGPIRPEWESPPPPWIPEFQGLLALRDLGPGDKICPGGPRQTWPDFAPVGAGLVVRRQMAQAYAAEVNADSFRRDLDRTGLRLGSGGDNDLVFSVLHGGADIGYFPPLGLTHLIPAFRMRAGYMARLNSGIMRTWTIVLKTHDQCPWPAIDPWTVPARCARAFFRMRAWRSPAHYIRWRGNCGQFHGQSLLPMFPISR